MCPIFVKRCIFLARFCDCTNKLTKPSLEALKKLAQAFRVTTDSLIFEPEEQRIVKQLLEGMIIKYESERWSSKAR